jgi:hypothetical protein
LATMWIVFSLMSWLSQHTNLTPDSKSILVKAALWVSRSILAMISVPWTCWVRAMASDNFDQVDRQPTSSSVYSPTAIYSPNSPAIRPSLYDTCLAISVFCSSS